MSKEMTAVSVKEPLMHISKRDGIGIWDTKEFQMNVTKDATLLLMEVPMR